MPSALVLLRPCLSKGGIGCLGDVLLEDCLYPYMGDFLPSCLVFHPLTIRPAFLASTANFSNYLSTIHSPGAWLFFLLCSSPFSSFARPS